MDIANNNIDNKNIQEQSGQNTTQPIQSPQRQQSRKRAGAGNQRENDRYDRCRPLGPVIPENLHPEQHLYGHHEDNQRAGNGKRRNIDLKQIEYHIPHKQKGEECNQRIDCRFPSDNILSLLLHIDNNRSKPRYIDYSKQNNKSTQEILKTKRYYFHILHSLRCTTTR